MKGPILTKTGCIICSKELIYTDCNVMKECYICHEKILTNVTCINDHFICDTCHSGNANDVIEKYTINSKIDNPIVQALELMNHPQINMHGPEHHFLIAGALISSYYNKLNDTSQKEIQIPKARKRAEKVVGGSCGFHGNCGAAVGTGIFISIITGATPLSDSEWQQANLMTARALTSVAIHGGPRCCKRNVFLSVIEAIKFVNENLKPLFEIPEIKCRFNHLNRECKLEQCNFYHK